MSTSVNVNEPLRPQVRTRGFTGGVTRAAMGLLIAVGLGLVGTIYLNSLVGPADLIAFASAATD
jgi:O-antigen/teichoic acid export membrane protein